MTPTSTTDPKLDLLPITTTGQEAEDYHFNILAVGPAKSGKTHFLSTFPNLFCLYCEENRATIEKFPGIQLSYISSWPQFETHALPALRQHSWYQPTDEGKTQLTPLSCTSFGLDGLANLFALCVEHHSTLYDGYKLWGMVLAKWTLAIRTIARLSKPPNACHVVVTCHTRDHENESGNITKVGLDIAGQSAAATPRQFDSVFLLNRTVKRKDNSPAGAIESVLHQMYSVNPNPKFEFVGDGVGGSQFATLPPILENTYQALTSAWKANQK